MLRRLSLDRALAALGFLLTGLLLTTWAKDFWVEKQFTQWDESEALMMLSNSPWAKTQNAMGDYGEAFVPWHISTDRPGAAVNTPQLSRTQGFGGTASTPL